MRKIIRRAAAVLLSAALLLTGTVSAAAQIDPVEERLAAMSLREKVGQLFVVRVEALDPSGQSDSTRLTWAERQGLKKYPVGGIVVFRQNVKSPEQLKKLLADFQAASGINRFFICKSPLIKICSADLPRQESRTHPLLFCPWWANHRHHCNKFWSIWQCFKANCRISGKMAFQPAFRPEEGGDFSLTFAPVQHIIRSRM